MCSIVPIVVQSFFYTLIYFSSHLLPLSGFEINNEYTREENNRFC